MTVTPSSAKSIVSHETPQRPQKAQDVEGGYIQLGARSRGHEGSADPSTEATKATRATKPPSVEIERCATAAVDL